ncbi:MAG: KdsC family phosphatase [Brachymonas sp.]
MNLPVPTQALVANTALALPEALLTRARAVRVVFFDVDGVLTDGKLYYSEQGEVLKAFHSLDGHGLKMLQRAGITPAIISGRDSPALRTRLAFLEQGFWGRNYLKNNNKTIAAQASFLAIFAKTMVENAINNYSKCLLFQKWDKYGDSLYFWQNCPKLRIAFCGLLA